MAGGRLGNVTGVLLTVGSSARVGQDDAHPEREGEHGSGRAAELLARLFEETLLVGGDPEPEAPGRRVAELEGTPCALLGLVGALEAASAERVLVLSSDLPLPPPDLLLALTAWPEQDAVVPCDAAGDHPLCAVYRRDSVLSIAREQLADGELRLPALLERIETVRVTLDELGLGDLGSGLLSDADTPLDLDALARREGR